MFDRHKLPCPIDGMSFKYSYKVKIFCDIDAIAMVSACLSSPGCFPEPVLPMLGHELAHMLRK